MSRDLLAKAIVAFDCIMEDVLACIEEGREPHPSATRIMEVLVAQIFPAPSVDQKMQEYIINMADLAARIKIMAMEMNVSDHALDVVIIKQRERLSDLGKKFDLEIKENFTHKGTTSIN